MATLQQLQMGMVDFWTFHEVMETPNVGAPPKIPLPPLQPIPPELQQFIMQQTMLQMQTMLASGMPPMGGPQPVTDPTSQKQYILDPMSGQIMELRVPTTIVERLQAQNLLGIGLTVSAQGRKATNEAPAHTETKGDRPGGRQTTSTSEK
jgi:hypothetical protein